MPDRPETGPETIPPSPPGTGSIASASVDELRGTAMHYAWGSPDALPRLLGREPDGRPWAELWFGTHPGGPAHVTGPAGPVALLDRAGELPFLAKFLAAAAPLSLQVHPTRAQAEAGFAREDAAGVPRDAPQRTYRDRAAKPEVMIALSPFRALCGFRPIDEAVTELRGAGATALAERVARHGHGEAVRWLLAERPVLRPDLDRFRLLDDAYPGDPGALVALLLNEVHLEPGEAVFLPAGQLHMYLEGLGVEVMGASDNVVRGGLTVKHVDLPELARVIDPAPRRPDVLRPGTDGWYALPTPVFGVQELRSPTEWRADGPELVLYARADPPFGAGTAAYVPDGEPGRFGGGLAYRVSRSRAS